MRVITSKIKTLYYGNLNKTLSTQLLKIIIVYCSDFQTMSWYTTMPQDRLGVPQ